MHNKKTFDLENEGKDHGVQHSQWCHMMANINFCIRLEIALTVSEIFMFQVDIRTTIFAMVPYDGNYQHL